MSSKYKMEVGPSAIRVYNYDLGDCEKLEWQFKIYDIICHKYNFFGMSYDEEEKILYLPRGIDVSYVQNCLNIQTVDIIWKKADEYETFEDVKIKYKPRDDTQKEALRFMLGIGEYEKNAYHTMLMVSSTTGFGKSYCSIYTMCFTKIKSIVITYAITILKQWKDYVLQYTNLTDKDIYLISGSESINMLLSQRTRYKTAKIFLVSHSTLRDYANKNGWHKIDELFQIIKVGQCFIDEAHRDFENICRIMAHTNVSKTYFVTATPARSSKDENRIYQISTKNIPKIVLRKEEDKHINYIAIKYSSYPTPKQKSDMYNAYGIDRNKYVNYVVDQPNFYCMLRIIMDMVGKADGPVLFYIDTNAAILKVYKWLAEEYPEYAGEIGIYSGLVAQDVKTEEKKKKIILSTLKSAGAAEQIDGLKMAVVLAAPFKSTVTAIQAAGRLRDPNTYFIELIDLSFQSIKKYYYYKLSTYNKYMLTVSDVYYNQEKLHNKADDLKYERDQIINRIPFVNIDERFEGMSEELNPFYIPMNLKTNPFYNPDK